MNADEIVEGLSAETLCENCPHNFLHESACFAKGCYFVNAAALIEALQAEVGAAHTREDEAYAQLASKESTVASQHCMILDLQAQLNDAKGNCEALHGMYAAVENELSSVKKQLAASQRKAQDARNELCERCGRYKEAHNGSCDGCRWKG